jgi:hypothetical protein
MGKVPADTDALGMTFRGGTVATGVMVSELNVVMDVVADRLNALPADIDAAE